MGAIFDYKLATAKVRATTGGSSDTPLEISLFLSRFYPVATVFLSGLSVRRIDAWIQRHQAHTPASLTECHDRRLRGGIVAKRGRAMIFVDPEDPDKEQRFTIAHEAGHFFQDHLFPRQEVLRRLGPGILPVLDGARPPTQSERFDALLANASLYEHAHLLEREAVAPDTYEAEAAADAFACEMLAPEECVQPHAEQYASCEGGVDSLRALLEKQYRLPARQAGEYAARLMAPYPPCPTLWQRLRMV